MIGTSKWVIGAVAAALALALPAAAQEGVGEVAFANSGDEAAQSAFRRGLALLHNFEYSDAAEAFRAAQAADPDFAMAYWGEAMTHNHPVWQEQDREAGRAALEKLGPTREARRAAAGSERERAYLATVETLYGEGSKEDRDALYSREMAALMQAYPDDVDARAFYALSLLGLAHEGRDFALYMRAAAALEEVFPENRRHPGVLHYLIHSYDDPIHAPLGLRAARLYGDVAPNAGHALHMTSHIFVAMGMWDDVIARNRQATDVVNAQRAERGREAYHCGHYPEWLVYGYLQRGDIEAADAAIAACRTNAESGLAEAEEHPTVERYRNPVPSYSDILLMRLVDTGEWAEPPLDVPDGTYLRTRWMRAYGDMLRARGNAAALAPALVELQAAAEALEAASDDGPASYFAPHRAVILLQASGLDKLASGDLDGGIADLRAAAEAEAAMPMEFGPPAIHKPSYELLAEELARLDRMAEARSAYRQALARTPGRRLAVDGLAALDSDSGN